MSSTTETDARGRLVEELEVAGEHLMTTVRDLAHESDVRRITLKRVDGSTLFEIPLQAGLAVTVLTAALAPVLVAVGAVAVVVSTVTLVVARDEDTADA